MNPTEYPPGPPMRDAFKDSYIIEGNAPPPKGGGCLPTLFTIIVIIAVLYGLCS